MPLIESAIAPDIVGVKTFIFKSLGFIKIYLKNIGISSVASGNTAVVLDVLRRGLGEGLGWLLRGVQHLLPAQNVDQVGVGHWHLGFAKTSFSDGAGTILPELVNLLLELFVSLRQCRSLVWFRGKLDRFVAPLCMYACRGLKRRLWSGGRFPPTQYEYFEKK